MEFKLYDTLTREKRVFAPIDSARVRMYVCGPTVYDFAHIGNARPVIVFDVLFRLLRHIYGPEHVIYARNITDVDDKINARAAERGVPIRELTEETYNNFKSDVAALGCLPPTVEPRATEHIDEMKALIEKLVASGHAYVAEDNVLFNVPSMPDYGRLSKRPLDEMIAGSRVEVAPYKKDPQDFVLWKPSKPGEPAWPSPCGIAAPGRPGWHIECSAMADHWLWTKVEPSLSPAGLAHPHQFDIHGGGIDLVFPHHENEIAQSRCVFHTGVMANYWMHNGFLQVEGEKMSKSLGNFVTIRDLLKFWQGREIRLLMLMTHYRQPINWTEAGLVEARTIWTELVQAAADVQPSSSPPDEFIVRLADDLNTPSAIAFLHELKERARTGDLSAARDLWASLDLLGLVPTWQWTDALPDYVRITAEAEPFFERLIANGNGDGLPRQLVARMQDSLDKQGKSLTESVLAVANQMASSISIRELRDRKINPASVKSRIDERLIARNQKDFGKADRIRDELAAMGVVLKDSKDGTTWEIAR